MIVRAIRLNSSNKGGGCRKFVCVQEMASRILELRERCLLEGKLSGYDSRWVKLTA